MYGYEAIADALVTEGVDMVFTVMSADTFELIVEIADKWGVRVISARNEHGAAAMADGYARVTGRPGVCVVTCGPGLTNAATALTTANRRRSPVICIAGESALVERHYIKAMDQRRLAEATAGSFCPVRHPETIAEDVQLAFRHVRSGRGPTVLAVPRDIMEGEMEMEWEYHPSSAMTPPTQRVHPDPELVAQAAAILRKAERPVILAGRGAVTSGAAEEIVALAERVGAVLATTLQARGYLADHPFNVGIAGSYATNVGHSLLTKADCVLAVGASLNVYTTESGLLFPEAKIIHIDSDPHRIGEATPVALGVVGDARAALAALNGQMNGKGFATKRGFWDEDVKSRIAASRSEQEVPYVEAPGKLDPRQLVAEIDRILPTDRIVVTDAGYSRTFVVRAISLPDPNSLVWTTDFGSVGMGLPIGVGVALARPDRHVVVFIGDGGFMMGMEELDTAVRYRIPMTVVVLNDGAYGAEVHHMEERKKPIALALFDNPELAEVARALGAVGLIVRNLKDLEVVSKQVGKGDRPVLVDVRINGSVVYKKHQGVAIAPHLDQQR